MEMIPYSNPQNFSKFSLEMDVEEAKATELLLNLSESVDVVMEETEPSEPQWLQQEEPMALWVMWRGKWQAGIKCARADWPLMILRGKPTNDSKNFFVVFFPNIKCYSWSDMELVRPINELPDPIAYKSHKYGLKKVQDLTSARRYIMQKLTVDMFFIVDQFNLEVVVEAARDVIAWKEFAMEATRSISYQDLGRMLVMLHSMIMQRYIDPMWLENSFPSWVQKCNDAVNAESVELLNEEFDSSIQWNKVKSTCDSSVQPMVLSEWKTWKHDITKWFSISHGNKGVFNSDVQASRKRAKRGKTSNASVMESDTSPQGLTATENIMLSTPENGLVLWDGSQLMKTREANGLSRPQIPNLSVMRKPFRSAKKSQQCRAFIESKGRQCGRWAIERDFLCCVHSPTHLTPKSAKNKSFLVIEKPILCAGITGIGTKCKHRSLRRSLFCKKHRLQTSETNQCQALVPFREPERSVSNGNTSFFTEMLQDQDDNLCVGYFSENNYVPCNEFSRKHSLYCKQHLPNWLKPATNRKSRIISKEVYVDLLKGCSSREEKLTLHQACELFYKLFKRLLSLRNSVPMGEQVQWAISEASRDVGVGEFLFKIVSNEKERLTKIWGFTEGASPDRVLVITNGVETSDEEKSSFGEFACAICLDSFGNKNVLATHVEERHHVEFVETCMLLQCIPCGSHFGDKEQLLVHVQAQHPFESSQEPEGSESQIVVASQNKESTSCVHRYVCKFCSVGFKFLTDLGRHHQAEHMGANPVQSRGPNKFKKSLGAVSYIKKKKKMQGSISLGPVETTRTESRRLPKVQKPKLRPNNLDILTAARSACCRLSLERSLKARFRVLPKRIYLKAAKLCGQNGVQVQWNQEGYICSKGCKPFKGKKLLRPLIPRPENDRSLVVLDMGEHFNELEFGKSWVLCSDISFGRELVPICCVVDEDLLNSEYEMPWKSFTYVTKSIHIPSMDLVKESLQHKCGCRGSVCSPVTCDHVYLFGNDFEEARDIYGKSMKYRFPYDDKERIILEEGYPVYECNELCGCSRTCPNRVLQKGIRMKLEVFRTENKGWGLRACEDILRGTFVCEYIGEVLDQQEAHKRRYKYGKEGCNFIHDIDASINVIGMLTEGESDYAIDATTHGNISRFINHSCSPNLVTHQVIVESMETPLAHIGLYASIDIAAGEEITRDYGTRKGAYMPL